MFLRGTDRGTVTSSGTKIEARGGGSVSARSLRGSAGCAQIIERDRGRDDPFPAASARWRGHAAGTFSRLDIPCAVWRKAKVRERGGDLLRLGWLSSDGDGTGAALSLPLVPAQFAEHNLRVIELRASGCTGWPMGGLGEPRLLPKHCTPASSRRPRRLRSTRRY